MKKIIAIAFVGMFGVMTLGSCKKDYTCECTTTISGFDPIKTSSTVNASKKDAKTACEKNNGTNGVSCKIK